MENFDLVIIGAGWFGLAAGKTALEINPSLNLVILDSAASIGGVWARERLYDELRTNNVVGSYEYSDFPMTEGQFGVQSDEHIPGKTVHAYLNAYAETFGINHNTRLRCTVVSATYTPDKYWDVNVNVKASVSSLRTPKLIIATGLTSQPIMPRFPGQDGFGAPLLHAKQLATLDKTFLESNDITVSILGGTKSAWDAAYTCASKGAQVDWIIRESGHGPVWMAPARVTPLKLLLEKLPTTRALSWFSPCVWGASSLIRTFLHETWLGQKIVKGFWALLESDLLQCNDYDQHPDTAKLRPWVNPFWVANSLSILNYPTDIFQLIRQERIRVHVADIDRLSAHTVHLSTGDRLRSDALICCTGWKPTPAITFSPAGIERDLGFPWAEDCLGRDRTLLEDSSAAILHNFPTLRDDQQPPHNPSLTPVCDEDEDPSSAVLHPFRLARFLVPPNMFEDRSIVFLGVAMSFSTTVMAEIQSLWSMAYLFNGLTLSGKNSTDIWSETALHTEFCRLRYPGGFGARHPDFVFDLMPYLDLLMTDLGLATARKSSLWRNLFLPHGPADYRGLVGEWKADVAATAVAARVWI
ncbi:FAD/NAD(P)-binding domain-containing protein [Aspergillus ellipticus CBS 707.79]|uniref:FAD/NAD(P)-binding domain-containing protein n=1 Tax=Aspergillus ellipticus CBS 707.79 TaxID=1448320 RepID=A0A319D9S9_9EURO|nr:FAD/NAD(P)-binding domain-containing protein [Aspergillus ellipticus CBS 707.79]